MVCPCRCTVAPLPPVSCYPPRSPLPVQGRYQTHHGGLNIKTKNKKLLGAFAGISDNFRKWVLDNICYHYKHSDEEALFRKLAKNIEDEEYFMYVDGDLYFGEKIKIEKALNKKMSEWSHYNFFIYDLKKDKEVYTKLAIVE